MADLRIREETRETVIGRLSEVWLPLRVVAIDGRWHKEIVADLAALLPGGPAAVGTRRIRPFRAHGPGSPR